MNARFQWGIRRVRAALQSDALRLSGICLGIGLLMTLLLPGKFLTVRNLTSMGFQFPELGLFALAVMLSLITGGIDLSVVSTANLAGILAALVLTRLIPEGAGDGATLVGLLAAVGLALATGALCGLGNGLIITRLGVTPILATLGTMQLYMGLSLVITRGPAVSGFPKAFLALGNGTLAGVPVPLWLFAMAGMAVALLLGRTVFGVQAGLIGSSDRAARFAGIPVTSVLVRTYVVSGVLAGLAGLIIIAHTNSAKADYGASYLLQAVLVAILGGVDPKGGFGRVRGVVLALLALQFLSSGFSLLRFSQFTKEFAWGVLLLLAMGIGALGRRDGRP